MVHTFHIDDSNGKAQALMAFLRTLEFVREEQEDWGVHVSAELDESLIRGLKDEKDGNVISHETVLSELRKEFPHLGL